MKERVFVSGANGMLGTHIVRNLVGDGYDVIALVYPGTQVATIDGLGVKIVEGDLTTALPLKEWLSTCTHVIHVAASTSIWPRRNKKIWDINVDATLKLAQAAKDCGIKRFVHIGTANSFPLGTINNPGKETGEFAAHKYKLDYIDSKFAIQQQLLALHKKEDFPVIIVNPTFMIGPYDSGPTSGTMILEMMKGKVQAYATGGKNFVYTGDVARAAVNALHMGRTGECYIGGGENLTYRQFAQLIKKITGKDQLLFPSPLPITLMVGLLMSGIAMITGKAPKLSYTVAKMSKEGNYYTAQKAVNELKMPQTPVEQAVRECIAWFRDNGYI